VPSHLHRRRTAQSKFDPLFLPLLQPSQLELELELSSSVSVKVRPVMVPAMSNNTPVQSESERKSLSKREYLQYQSTPDGDIRIIVESPNEGGANALTSSIPKLGGPDSGAVDPSFPSTNTNNDQKSRHRRDLSAHFQDATNLSEDPTAGNFPPPHAASSHDDLQVSSSSDDDDDGNRQQPPTYAAAAAAHGSRPPPPPQASPTVGQKHRRVFSGGVSNPGVAHRRINSRGNTAVVNRGGRSSFRSSPRSSPRMSPSASFRKSPPLGTGSRRTSSSAGHRREDSGGLDMLSAVANNFSEHELAEAAGAAALGTGAPLPPPPPPPGHKSSPIPPAPSSSSGHQSYQYGNSSSQSYSSHGGPPHPSTHYHHHPAGYYGASGGYPSQYDPRYQQSSQHYYHGYHQAPPPTPSYYPEPRGYPVQYAPPRGHYQSDSHPSASQSSSRKSTPPQSSVHHPLPAQVVSTSHHPEALAGGEAAGPSDPAYGSYAQRPAPVTSGTSIGSQTFVTSICVDDGKESGTVRRASARTDTPPGNGSMHHRKMSSFTASIGAFMEDLSPARVAYEVTGGAPAAAPRNEPVPPLFQTLDEGDRLLQELSSPQAQPMVSTAAMAYGYQPTHPPPPPLPQSSPNASPPPSRSRSRSTSRSRSRSKVGTSQEQAPTTEPGDGSTDSTNRRYMSGGSSKRVRRKCTVEGCPNRVVQGGLCISHGAKRKQCAHPGCNKNVKKAGLCSTHGPARKKCDYERCTKVAVQGGRCISHGAKKKLCTISGCSKQAILAGMCKKHHDEHEGKEPYRGGSSQKKTGGRKKAGAAKLQKKASIAPEGDLCVVIDEQSTHAAQAGAANQQGRGVAKPTHQRGLSIFTDMSAVDTIIGGGDALIAPDDALRNDPDAGSPGSGSEIRAAPSYDGRVSKPTHQRGLSIFTEEAVADTIIQNPDF